MAEMRFNAHHPLNLLVNSNVGKQDSIVLLSVRCMDFLLQKTSDAQRENQIISVKSSLFYSTLSGKKIQTLRRI